MKNYFNLFLSVVMIFSVFVLGCQNDTAKPEDVQDEITEVVIEELTLDVKARNIFANSTVVLSGTMMLAFSDVFQGEVGTFKDVFTKLGAEEAEIEEIDEKIAALPVDMIEGIDLMKEQIDSAYIAMKESNEAIYNKMFSMDIMKEGVEIAEKYELSDDFKPLTQNLSQSDIKRHIFKIVAAGEEAENSEEPILKMYKEIFEWMQKVSVELVQDVEISAFMEKMSEKDE